MKNQVLLFLAMALTIVMFALPANASVLVNFESGDGQNEWCQVGLTNCTNVLVTPDPSWDMTPGTGRWISHTNSGIGGVIVPNTDADNPTAVFFEEFYLPYALNRGSGTFYADDTLRLILYNAVHPGGVILAQPNFTPGTNCAAGPPGCVAGRGAYVDFSPYLSVGTNLLAVPAYQKWGWTSGVKYAGSIVSSPIPEPATFVLLGGALITLGFIRRHKMKA